MPISCRAYTNTVNSGLLGPDPNIRLQQKPEKLMASIKPKDRCCRGVLSISVQNQEASRCETFSESCDGDEQNQSPRRFCFCWSNPCAERNLPNSALQLFQLW